MATETTLATATATATAPAPESQHPITPHPISTLPHTPAHAYLIRHPQEAGHKDTQIHDLSPHISTLYPLTPASSLTTASNLVTSTSIPSLYTLHRDNILGTHFSLHDASGVEIAEWKNPVASVHLGHKVHIRFTDLKSKENGIDAHLQGQSESFTKDETKFIWEVDPWKDEHQILSKITGPPTVRAPQGEKLPIAIFAAEAPHKPSGLLILDESEIDPMLCLLTLCARLDAPKSQGRIDRAAEFVLSAVIGF